MIIFMWSGPRNLSTALMRSFENRKDTYVIDEPFYAYYLKKTGLNHPMKKEIIMLPTGSGYAIESRASKEYVHVGLLSSALRCDPTNCLQPPAVWPYSSSGSGSSLAECAADS